MPRRLLLVTTLLAACGDSGHGHLPDASNTSVDGTPTGTDAAEGPTVVATFTQLPASLALSGDTLFVTLAETAAGHDGKLQSVSVTGGVVAPLASGLHSPRAVSVSGNFVYWVDIEDVFPDFPDVMSLAVAGGTPVEVGPAFVDTRLAVAGSTLYAVTANLTAISSFALTGAASSATPVYGGSPPDGIHGLDSDGTSVFFLTNGATNFDLLSIPVGGGTVAPVAHNASSGSIAFDFVVDDATAVYWSDSGTGTVFSATKPSGTAVPLATFATGSSPVQIALDGENIYALSSMQLAKFPKTGGTPVVLASVSGVAPDTYLVSLGNASALVIDAQFVYWLEQGRAQILKIAK